MAVVMLARKAVHSYTIPDVPYAEYIGPCGCRTCHGIATTELEASSLESGDSWVSVQLLALWLAAQIESVVSASLGVSQVAHRFYPAQAAVA